MPEKKVSDDQVKKAVEELEIDVPVQAVRMVGNRLELYLYGGQVVSWTAPAAARKRKPAQKKRSESANQRKE